jgi:hypothetical protein
MEGQTTQWPKEKEQKDNNAMSKRKETKAQIMIYKT